ncbi:MAG: hypothetical protein COV48_10400 [Elusimicrobia bacterium CG11_big_fil_rev_8_21_14_0_20_64_6]|nr:MAG: hypothetical protein COV48_10400 [Elusimicrobia bacterium CG11_big_fil_rev_8_21_14_0_20_64_6]
MKMSLFLSLLLAAPTFAAAASVRISGGSKAENKLRLFIEQNAQLKAHLVDASRREEAYLAEVRESDLRDAVSDIHSGDNLRSALERTEGEKRAALLQTLPGMKPAAVPVCRTVASCPTPDLALDVADAEHLPDSMRSLIRPWMVLQQARGSSVILSPLEGPGDAALSVKLKGLDVAPLIINISPRLLGGFKVWIERPLFLAALYGRERDAVLKTSR